MNYSLKFSVFYLPAGHILQSTKIQNSKIHRMWFRFVIFQCYLNAKRECGLRNLNFPPFKGLTISKLKFLFPSLSGLAGADLFPQSWVPLRDLFPMW